MRILLTEPLTHVDTAKDFSGIKRGRLNFGLACLSSYLKAHGHEVLIADPDLISRDEYESLVRNGGFKLAGMSVWTSNVLRVCMHAATLKKLVPSIRLVVGGVHASLFPEFMLHECESLDFVIAGEGEKSLLALANALSEETFNPARVPALSYRRGGEVHSNPPVEPLSPEEFPLPDYSGAGIQKFQSHFPHFKSRPT